MGPGKEEEDDEEDAEEEEGEVASAVGATTGQGARWSTLHGSQRQRRQEEQDARGEVSNVRSRLNPFGPRELMGARPRQGAAERAARLEVFLASVARARCLRRQTIRASLVRGPGGGPGGPHRPPAAPIRPPKAPSWPQSASDGFHSASSGLFRPAIGLFRPPTASTWPQLASVGIP